jgi:hypothetical protein
MARVDAVGEASMAMLQLQQQRKAPARARLVSLTPIDENLGVVKRVVKRGKGAS